MERRRRLIVLETLDDRAVDDHLVVLQLAADDAKCVVLLMMVDLDFAEARGAARRHPFLLVVIVDHDGSAGADNTEFAII